MNVDQSLVRMLRQLQEDTMVMASQGAGYYTCIPLATRYNKLLEQAQRVLPAGGLVATFDKMPEADPKDPSDKMKVVQAIRVEINQLITLLESPSEGHT
jgi:hypothetical protein